MIKNYSAAMMYKKYFEDLSNMMDAVHAGYSQVIFEDTDEETVTDIINCLVRARASIRRAEELMDERIKDYYRITSNEESE